MITQAEELQRENSVSIPSEQTFRKEAVYVSKFIVQPFDLAKIPDEEFVDVISCHNMAFEEDGELTQEDRADLADFFKASLESGGADGFAWKGTDAEKWYQDLCGCAVIWKRILIRTGTPQSLILSIFPGGGLPLEQKAEKLSEMFSIDKYVETWLAGVPVSDVLGS